MIKHLILVLLFVAKTGLASEHQVINALGSSPKGQYVALEEYGYHSQKHSYFVQIKILNVWTKQYEGNSVSVELPAHRPAYLKEARIKARTMAQDLLGQFKIVQ